MSNAQHAHSKIVDSQREIASLRRINATLRARASHLNARHIATLDTLDALQTSHAAELNTAYDANSELERRIAHLSAVLKGVQDERDDLRDAVERFIEKVEVSDGLHMLPRNSLAATDLTEPLPPLHRRKHHLSGSLSSQKGDNIQELLQVAQAELAREKQEHRRTWQDAATQISALRAQVARRDAEMESLLQVGIEEEARHDSAFTSEALAVPELPRLSKKALRELRAEVYERRRNLDQEVRELSTRLVEAKTGTSQDTLLAEQPQTSIRPRSPSPLPPHTEDAHFLARSADHSESADPEGEQPSTPTGPTHKSSNSQTQTHLTAAIFTNTPLRPTPRKSASLPPPLAKRSLPSVFLPATPPTRLPPPDEEAEQSPRPNRTSHIGHILQDLDHKISALAILMEEFETERANLVNISHQPQVDSREDIEAELSEVWLLEEECIRLRALATSAAASINSPPPPATAMPNHEYRFHTPRKRPVPAPTVESFETPVRRSSNAHSMELSVSRSREFGAGAADSAPSTLLSPANIDNTPSHDMSRNRFNTADAVYTMSVGDESQDEGSAITYSGSEFTAPGVEHSQLFKEDLAQISPRTATTQSIYHVLNDGLDVDETLRLAREELARKDAEMQQLQQQIENLQLGSRPQPLPSRQIDPLHLFSSFDHDPPLDRSDEPSSPRPPFLSRNTQ